jgi:hypothetical protein
MFMSSELGGVITQFKGFALASHQRLLIPAMQRGQKDGYMLQGITALMLTGMMSYAFKELAAGRELSKDPSKWVAEGVDRSGLIAVIMEAHNMTEKLTGVGLSRVTDGTQASRYSSRSTAEALLGPSLGLALNLSDVATKAASGEMSESDLGKIRRVLPYQNLFYIRQLLDGLQGDIADGLELKRNN